MTHQTIDVDPALAVDKALPRQLRDRLAEALDKSPGWRGAKPADYLDEASNADTYTREVDPWLEREGRESLSWLIHATGLPHLYCQALLVHAFVTHLTAGWTGDDPKWLAYAAARWAEGWAGGHADEARFHAAAAL